MMTEVLDSRRLRELILNTRKPLVLRNFQHGWCCFTGDLREWCTRYDEAATNEDNNKSKVAVAYERMPLRCGATPQWERKRQRVNITATQFLELHRESQNFWTGLNYVRAHELPAACTEGVDFGVFGFPQANDDCSIWLSSRGANTPCHYDTYGCNIVLQVYGSKSWLLFPPGTPLTSTRIPYEESSVYCLENFYAPDPAHLSDLESLHSHAYKCVLKPNDVLIVPRHWWHYVETLETSLSINAWIPLQLDVTVQLEECIVKYLIERCIDRSNPAVVNYVLNPNQLQQVADEEELFVLFTHLLEAQQSVEPAPKTSTSNFHYAYLTLEKTEQLQQACIAVNNVAQPTPEEFRQLLLQNSKRFDASVEAQVVSPLHPVKEALFNSVCSSRVINEIKKELEKRLKT